MDALEQVVLTALLPLLVIQCLIGVGNWKLAFDGAGFVATPPRGLQVNSEIAERARQARIPLYISNEKAAHVWGAVRSTAGIVICGCTSPIQVESVGFCVAAGVCTFDAGAG